MLPFQIVIVYTLQMGEAGSCESFWGEKSLYIGNWSLDIDVADSSEILVAI